MGYWVGWGISDVIYTDGDGSGVGGVQVADRSQDIFIYMGDGVWRGECHNFIEKICFVFLILVVIKCFHFALFFGKPYMGGSINLF